MTWQNTLRFHQLSWKTPIVYGWFRGDVCLYIGMSISGLSRPLCSTHHIIGKVIRLRKTDQLCWSEYDSVVHARMMEKFLIRNLQPKFNDGNGSVFKANLRKYKLDHAELIANL